MAILFSDLGDGLLRSGSFLNPATDWTKSGWVQFRTPIAAGYTFRLLGAADFTPPWMGLFRDGADTLAYGGADTGAGEVDPAFSATLTGGWIYLALRYKASTTELTFVVNGVQIGSAGVINLGAVPAQGNELVGTADTYGAPNIAVAYLRDWQARLSDAELLAEMSSPIAVRTTALLADTPITSVDDLADLSGHARGWTLIAGAVNVSGPLTMEVSCPPVTTGVLGTAYASSVTASIGIPPYAYSIAGGGLPTGVSLNPGTGAITGTPITAGSFGFTVRATDSVLQVAENICTITVSAVASGCTDHFTLTVDQAISELALRLDDTENVHWTRAELFRYLVEALRTLSACTQRYRNRAAFTTTSGEPFYDLPTVLPSLRGYHVTDTDLVRDLEYALMEPPTPTVWTGTEMFSLDLIVDAVQSRLLQFIGETGGVLTRSLTGLTPDANGRVMLPGNVMTVRRAAWRMLDGTVIPLKLEDEWTMQHFAPSWPQNPTPPKDTWPTGYSVAVTPPVTIQLAPAPTAAGTLDLLAVVRSTDLDPTVGVLLGVPDDWSWVIKWGALSELLNRDGVAYDPARAAYCEARYQQGVALAKAASVVLQGYVDGNTGSLKSLIDTDMYRRNWQTTAGVPVSILTAGWTTVGLAPKPNGVGYTVTLDVVANVFIPTLGIDCLPVDPQLHDAFLDYAQHIAQFKEGVQQTQQSMGLLDNFMRACGITVKIDVASVPDRGALFDQTAQDERVKPREGA